jgi:peptidoglycan DL-endopeptidase CwlO
MPLRRLTQLLGAFALVAVLGALTPAPASATHARGHRLTPAHLPYGPLIAAAAQRHGVPTPLLTALVWQESGFRPMAVSPAGARGLTQLMPGTAQMLGVADPHDPVQALDGGARYLAALLRAFRSKPLALAGYNAGPGAVQRHRGIPPYAETQQYVRMVLARERRLLLLGLR